MVTKGALHLENRHTVNTTPSRYLGVQELQQKRYFGGAHAYQVSWQAAGGSG